MAGMGFAPFRAMPRKISATSSDERDTRAPGQPVGRISLNLSAICSSGLMTSLIVLVATRV